MSNDAINKGATEKAVLAGCRERTVQVLCLSLGYWTILGHKEACSPCDKINSVFDLRLTFVSNATTGVSQCWEESNSGASIFKRSAEPRFIKKSQIKFPIV